MPQVIHESIIKDILQFIGDKDLVGFSKSFLSNMKSKPRAKSAFSSIAQASSDLNLVYPCFVSNSVSIEAAGMISKANERKNCQMLQLLFSAWQQQTLSTGEQFNPIAYLQQYHKNLNISTRDINVDDTLDVVDKIVKLAESYGIAEHLDPLTESEMIDYLKENIEEDNILPDNLSESSIIDYKIKKHNYGSPIVIQEAPTYRTRIDNTETREIDDDMTMMDYNIKQSQLNKFGTDIANDRRDFAYRQQKDQMDRDYTQQRDIASDEFKRRDEARKDEKLSMDRDKFRADMLANQSKMAADGIKSSKTLLDLRQSSTAQLQNADVKKANELVGTPMMITVHVVNDKGIIDPITFVVAVKSKLHVLDSKEVTQRIISKNRDRNLFSKIVKVATGEMSFVRDFLFAVDNAKIDALSGSKKGSNTQLWRVLEKMARKSKQSMKSGKQNEYLAISTLVISQEDVEYMKKYANVDVESVSVAKGILESYNLLSLVIVDENSESAKFIYNSDQDLYEELSFNQLEREATDGSYRKMVNLIGKMK